MTPATSRPRKGERYFYYHCISVNKMDKTACNVRRVPARALEEFVLKRLGLLSKSKEIVENVIKTTLNDADCVLPGKREARSRLYAELGKVEGVIKNLVGVLAQEGTDSPRYRVIMDTLDESQAKKDVLRGKLFTLDKEIAEYESREVDAEIVRQNLEKFIEVFGQCTDEEKKELLKLLIRDVYYDGNNSRVKIALRPVSGAWGDVAQLEGLFAYRQKWGGRSDCLRTFLDRFKLPRGQTTDFYLIDDSEFGLVLGPNGQKRILFPEEAQIARDNRRRAPHPPRIQRDLLEARQLRERLDKTPGLTKIALGRELGITRFEVIRRLNLLRLAPEIQERIMALPPTSHRCPISKRTLRHITVIPDFERQKEEFRRLNGVAQNEGKDFGPPLGVNASNPESLHPPQAF